MDESARDTFVTESLAGGLARQAIRDWRDRVARSRARLRDLANREFSTSKGVARIAREMNRLLGPLAFHSVCGEFKRKGVYQAWILPELKEIDGTEYLAVELNLFRVDLEGFRLEGFRRLAYIHPHALARMFLRMQTTALADVRKQIDSCLHFYPAIAEACEALDLRQTLIPTFEGFFRCDVRRDIGSSSPLVAKTWIANLASGHRDFAVIESIAEAAVEWKSHAPQSDQFHMHIPLSAPKALVDLLVKALRAHAWLTEPYEERPDHLTAIWDAARRQAEAMERSIEES